MRNILAGAMVITMALCLWAATIAFGAVTIDWAAPVFGLAILLTLLWAGKLLFAKVVSWKHSPMHLPVIVFLAYTVVRYFSSPLEYESRLELFYVSLYTLIYFAAACNFYRQRDRTILLTALMVLALVEALYGIWQFSTKADVVLHLQRPGSYGRRASGTFICPNHLAGFLEMAVSVLLVRVALWRSSKSSLQQSALQKVFIFYVAVIALTALIMTLSRSSWFAITVGLLTFLLWGEWRLRTMWPRLAVGTVSLCVLGLVAFKLEPVRHYISFTFAGYTKKSDTRLSDPTLGGRTIMWNDTIKMIRDYPLFGTAPGTWQWFHPKYRPAELQIHPEFAHNDVLHLASDYGLAGFAVVAALLICFFRHAAFIAGRNNGSEPRSFAIAAAIAVTTILVHSWFDFNLHIPANALLLVTLMGFTLAMDDSESRYPRVAMKPAAKYGLGVFLLLLCLTGSWFVGHTALACRYNWQGDRFKSFLYWDDALEKYQRAIALDPKFPEPYVKVADIYRIQSQWRREPAKLEERQRLARQAIDAYQKSLSLNPLNANVMVRLAAAYELAGEKESAEKMYRRAIELEPTSAFFHQQLGLFYRHIGDEPHAVELLEKSQKLYWDIVAALNLQEIKPQ